ncbi:choice-of-anchor D domain-containing protein [Rhizobacter sp. AJA081-3]|uniref:choice-of-anchor D domain-containing protein n=1 Tax=Rhizobacter sp. AJA081-3 TaxID=2753607 RepID=UPI001ADFBCD7|nr:choice-of-anchor D domain-containing protein [Rhizobacter sp. AJA081-3]QTN25701.1 choice-of-anchor D domain-containing protein [Rhizobacter sp. AJA081-3]
MTCLSDLRSHPSARRTAAATLRRFLAAMLLLAGAGHALAQDAVRGKMLYETPAGNESRACYQCHGFVPAAGPVTGVIAKAAGHPEVIQSAIDRNVGGMSYFKTIYNASQLADIAAYLGNPAAGRVTAPSTLPTMSATPAVLNFATTFGTEPERQAFVLSNDGGAGAAYATIVSIVLSGANPSDFTLYAVATRNGCAPNLVVFAGTACSLTYGFNPQAVGTRSATVTVTHTGQNSPLRLSLSGTASAAPQASMTLNANSLSFLPQTVGTTSAAQTVTVGNSGSAPLLVSQAQLTGTNTTDFALGGSCIGAGSPASVPAGGSCALSVTFAPRGAGTRSAGIRLTTNASTPDATVALSGSGTDVPSPVAALAPTTVDFGDVGAGATSPVHTVALSNRGSAALVVQGISASPAAYQVTHDCPASMATGASCTISLRLAPGAAGDAAGTLTVSTNAAGSPQRVALTGRGVAAGAANLAWSGSVDGVFAGDVRVGSVAPAKTFTLVNQGPGAATLGTFRVQGAVAASEFPLGGTCSANQTLAAGASCTVSVAFAPAHAGARSATLSVATVSGTVPPTIALSGQGQGAAGAALSWSATWLKLPDAQVNAASPEAQVSLANTGTAAVTVRELKLSDPALRVRVAAGEGCGALPLTLAPGHRCALVVTVDTARSASIKGELSLVASDGVVAAPLPIEAAVMAEAASSGGGCTLVDGWAAFDPALPALVIAAVAVLAWRRRKACGALAALALACAQPPAQALQVGEQLPSVSIDGAAGPRPVVDGKARLTYVDFWASWCGPCRQSFPWMNEVLTKYAAQGLQVVAVNVDVKRQDAEDFLARHPARFQIGFDSAGVLARQAGVKTMPTSLLVDATGKVLFVHHGFLERDRAALESRIQAALRGATP